MDKLSDALTSPVWWLSVVIAGIAINVISAYLKTSLDERLSSLSSRWRNRSEKRKAEFHSFVLRLADDPQEQILASFGVLRLGIFQVCFLIFGMFSILFAQFFISLGIPRIVTIVGMFVGIFAIIMGVRCTIRAMGIHSAIIESRKRGRRQAEQLAGGETEGADARDP